MHPMTANCLLATAVLLTIAISAEATQCYQCSYIMAESANTSTPSNSETCLSTDPSQLKQFISNCSDLAMKNTSGKIPECETQFGHHPESIKRSCKTMVNLTATEKISGICGPPERGITTCVCTGQLCNDGTRPVPPISSSTTTQPISKVGARTSASIGLRSSLFAVVILASVADFGQADRRSDV